MQHLLSEWRKPVSLWARANAFFTLGQASFQSRDREEARFHLNASAPSRSRL